MDPGTDDAATHRVAQRLSALFPSVDPRVVTGVVLDSYRLYVDHPNPNFVPVLVEETARDRLRGHLEARSTALAFDAALFGGAADPGWQ